MSLLNFKVTANLQCGNADLISTKTIIKGAKEIQHKVKEGRITQPLATLTSGNDNRDKQAPQQGAVHPRWKVNSESKYRDWYRLIF